MRPEERAQRNPIQVQRLRFGYPGGFSLDVPAFGVAAGESVALTGVSGSGKTTLLHLVAGILAAEAGEVQVAGLDITGLTHEERQDLRILRLGLVFQEFELLEYLSVFENVLLPYRLSPLLEAGPEVRSRAHSLVEAMGIGDKAGRSPDQLSQGERQRVAVCRALVTEPAVLLGDEPTANLDPGHRDHVLGSMLEYGRRSGTPVLVVTHDHEVLDRFDRVMDISEVVAS